MRDSPKLSPNFVDHLMIVIGKEDLTPKIISPLGIASYVTNWDERIQNLRFQLNQFGYYNLKIFVIRQ